MFSNVFFLSPIKKSFASLYELVQCLNYQEAIKSYQMLFRFALGIWRFFFVGPSISYTKMDWNRWKRPPPPAFWRHFPASRRRTSKALGLKSRIYLRWRMRFNETSMNPLSFWKCMEMSDFFLWMILESFKNHAGKTGTSKKMGWQLQAWVPEAMEATRWYRKDRSSSIRVLKIGNSLGCNFKYFHSNFGKIRILTNIFKRVETTN